MNIEQRYKKAICLFILAISLLLCLGTFYNRQIANAATSQGDTVDQLDTADQKTSSFVFQKKMSFRVLRAAVTNGEIDPEKNVPVTTYIGDTKQEEQKNIPVGVINENTVPKITGARFVGAYVEFPDTGKETQIYYTGRYSEPDVKDQKKTNTYTYYAYSPTPETGVLLEGKAYIKLEYEATYDLSYRVEDEQGNKLSDGLQEEDTGGYFVTPTTKLTQGTQLNIHFIPQRKASEGGKDYELKKLYIQKNDKEKTQTAIAFDDDDAAKADISDDSTVVAVVSPVTKYRMHVVNPFSDHHGYICWKGYVGNYNPKIYDSNTNPFENVEDNGSLTDAKGNTIHAIPAICDPNDKACIGTVKDAKGNVHGVRYIGNDNADPNFLYDNQDQFCSYTTAELKDENKHVVNEAGNPATTTAAPGGTFYFVMYSQRGTNWQFSRLSINGVALDAIYDGKVHDTKLKNGMVAHFKFDRYEDYNNYDVNYDLHLEKDRQNRNSLRKANKRLKFECWVSNASSDINVDFSCDAKDNESLTLTKAQGIKRIVASSYDEDHDGNLWWDSLYNGKPYWRKKGSLDWTWTEYNKDGQLSPNNVYNASDTLPHELFNETDGLDPWTKDKTPAFSTATNSYHTKMEDRPNDKYKDLYRYLYYDTLPGYDERTTKVHITGASDQSSHDVNYGSITLVPQSYHTKDTDNSSNKALSQAIRDGYTNYIQYYSKHMRHRNIQITMDPYKYKAIYDLDGGTLNGQDKYTDSQEYTIEEGANHILMPTATPVRKGYVFAGWQCTSTNIDPQFKDYKSKPRMPNEKYEINATTYDYGLDTEEQKITYSYYDPNKKTEVTVPERKFYVDKKDANNRFEFKALWVDRHNLPAGKDVYTIKTYKQVTSKDYESLNKDEKYQDETTKKLYRIVSSNDYLGTIDQTIIGIPPQEDDGYVFNKQASTVKLTHFKKTGANPEPDTLKYFYDFDGSQNLTIKHVTSGNMGDQNQSFDVYVTLKDSKGNPFNGEKAVEGTNATIWGGANTTGASTTGSLKFDNGIAKISLKGNQKLTIKNVDIGSYDIKEYSSGLYTTQYEIDQQGKSNNAISNASIVKNGNPIVTIYNVRDVPETGIYMPNDHPGQMFALLLLGAGAFYLVYKKNERRIKRMILVSTLKIEDMIKVHHK